MAGIDNLLNVVEEVMSSGEEALSTDGLDDLLILEAQQGLLDELSHVLNLEGVGKAVENIQMMLFCVKAIDAKLRMHCMNGTSDKELYVAEVHQAVALSGEVGAASSPSAMDMVRTEVGRIFAERIEKMGDGQPVDDGSDSHPFTPRTYLDGLGKCMGQVMRELETLITANGKEIKQTESEAPEGDKEQGNPALSDESESGGEADEDAGARPAQQRRTRPSGVRAVKWEDDENLFLRQHRASAAWWNRTPAQRATFHNAWLQGQGKAHTRSYMAMEQRAGMLRKDSSLDPDPTGPPILDKAAWVAQQAASNAPAAQTGAGDDGGDEEGEEAAAGPSTQPAST
ncbi:hypothetical protein KC343_g5179 [Hortaea werneckii]|nr:hypothetical protein KC352_g4766 [Hortaea werneckii]KAI7572213.1 hypothetical protein KC317_g954 [Hortaea werneckii]KAI7627202.1 hypothetical protein KC346_g865 [Hortaea werneckii]KAI7629521.1 hypothetical protein KC343_g5179 [Hortaea werneckii]KAI7682692.1 hypothetical protein KC319_g863 [Hortaea werneckii]